ncbi:MAG: sigma-70 family RNA polymerase sigma factor [Candidatus Omnitrophota bacterium]
MDTLNLIQRCRKKDPLAWEVFVNHYAGLIYWAIYDRLGKWAYRYHPEDIDEIHQNVFMNLWGKNKLEQIRTTDRVAGWLVILAGNEAIDYFKRERRRMPPLAAPHCAFRSPGRDAQVTTPLLRTREPSPRDQAGENELIAIIEHEINRLAPREKNIMSLYLLHHMKYREIADTLSLPPGTIATVIKNARARLKDRLGYLRGNDV